MKAILFIIILIALVTGLWQRNELSHLKQREVELSVALGKPPVPAEVVATKSTRREAKTTLDAAGFVDLITKPLEKGVPPNEEEREFLRNQIASASGRELKQWALALRDSGLPEELKRDILVALAPRLAENDPKLAAELVLHGDDGAPFRTVMRTWLATDAKAAAAWLVAFDPPLGPSRFRNLGGLDLPALTIAANVAADPANVDGLMAANGKTSLAVLIELSSAQAAADFSNVLQRFSQDSRLSEQLRLRAIGGALSRHRDPATARQILFDAALPEEQFITTAAIMIQALDPVGREAGVAWVRSLSDPRQREELLRLLSSSDGS
jgi:hypothetical protein